MDNVITHLVAASEIKKSWLGKVRDNYWRHLDEVATAVQLHFNAHILADLITYLSEELNFKEVLQQYSDVLSKNRNAAVIILIVDDRMEILKEINKPAFFPDFEIYCKKLNGSYYDYKADEILENINNVMLAINEIDGNYGLIIHVG